MPRFVILRHEMPPESSRSLHWDLMLEQDGALATWALPSEPQVGEVQIAQRLADHRLAYLDLEGPLSGGRGSVTQWDTGHYETVSHSDTTWEVRLQGDRLTCRVVVEATGDIVQVRFEPIVARLSES